MAREEPQTSADDNGDYNALLRQMALVDRVIGLEAEVARLHADYSGVGGARQEVERLKGELRAVYSSRAWLLGRALLLPVRVVKRVMGRS